MTDEAPPIVRLKRDARLMVERGAKTGCVAIRERGETVTFVLKELGSSLEHELDVSTAEARAFARAVYQTCRRVDSRLQNEGGSK